MFIVNIDLHILVTSVFRQEEENYNRERGKIRSQ